MSKEEKLFDTWAFVEKDIDQEHWFIKLKGGKYNGIVYRYTNIKLIPDSESISFDYDIVEHYDNDPTGKVDFNIATGDILKAVLDDAFKEKDYVIGDKRDTNNSD